MFSPPVHGRPQGIVQKSVKKLITLLQGFLPVQPKDPTAIGGEGPSFENLSSDCAPPPRFGTSPTLLLKNLKAEDVCVPYSEIIALPIEADFKAVINAFNACSHSRLPVYENTLDQILGMVHIKDVCKFFLKPTTFTLKKILRDVLFISPSMPLRDLLFEMQSLRTYMALVVDEFGGVDGLITVDTVIHYIVGDIQDADTIKALPQLVQQDSKTFIGDARLPLEELEKSIPLLAQHSLKKEDGVTTLGGLITSLLGYVPTQGELIKLPNGIELEVLEANPRNLSKLKIHLPPDISPKQS